ncbi:hypothetical protein PtB15_8B169 [Puccinia triticina]|nr:hypothetical protein PtB15_8B169 [Puccinia triticina]
MARISQGLRSKWSHIRPFGARPASLHRKTAHETHIDASLGHTINDTQHQLLPPISTLAAPTREFDV